MLAQMVELERNGQQLQEHIMLAEAGVVVTRAEAGD